MEDLVLSCLESRVEGNRNLYARFLVGPFLKGDALTVATALRRVLLSSVESIGITALYIQGITHEFSTIAGVRESVLELSLNFQAIVLCYDKTFFQKKSFFDDIQIGYLQVQGPKVVYANDLKLPLGIKLVDPTQYIARVSKEGSIVLKFIIGKKNDSFRASPIPLLSLLPRSCPNRAPSCSSSCPYPPFALKRIGVRAKELSKYSYPNPCSLYKPLNCCARTCNPVRALPNSERARTCTARGKARKSTWCPCTWCPCTSPKVSARAKKVSPSVRARLGVRVTPKRGKVSTSNSGVSITNQRFVQGTLKGQEGGKKVTKANICTQSNACKDVKPIFPRGNPLGCITWAGEEGRSHQNISLHTPESDLGFSTKNVPATPLRKQSIYFPILGELSKKDIVRAKKGFSYKTSSALNCFRTKTWLAKFVVHTFFTGTGTKLFSKARQSKFCSACTLAVPLLASTSFTCCAPSTPNSCSLYKPLNCSYTNRRFVRALTPLLTPELLSPSLPEHSPSVKCTGTKSTGKYKYVSTSIQGLVKGKKKHGLGDTSKTLFSLVSNLKRLKTKLYTPTLDTPVKQPKFHFFKSSKEPTFLSKNKVFKSDICLRNIIPLDLTLTPVLKVNFVIEIDDEVIYLRQKIRERIVLEVWTNGSIHPRQAVHNAALSLTDMFASFRSVYQVKSSFLPLFKIKQSNKKFLTSERLNFSSDFFSHCVPSTCLASLAVRASTPLVAPLLTPKSSHLPVFLYQPLNCSYINRRFVRALTPKEYVSTSNSGVSIRSTYSEGVRKYKHGLKHENKKKINKVKHTFLGIRKTTLGQNLFGKRYKVKSVTSLPKKKINNNFIYKTKLERNSLFFSDLGELPLPVNIYCFLKKKGIKKLSTLNNFSSFDLLLFLEGNTEIFYIVKRFLLKNNLPKKLF